MFLIFSLSASWSVRRDDIFSLSASWSGGRLAATLAALVVLAGSGAPAAAQDASSGAVLPDGGIPVTSDLVHRVCGTCHRADEQRRMSRISYQRTTPEGWQQTIRRMVLLNGLQIEPADAREAVRYLATAHGLAPDEVRLGAFEVERRNIDFRYEADPETQQTCNRCHSMGRVLNQRRTLEEWELLTAMHRGYYPLADVQSFLTGDWLGGPGPEDDGGRRPDGGRTGGGPSGRGVPTRFGGVGELVGEHAGAAARGYVGAGRARAGAGARVRRGRRGGGPRRTGSA